MKRPKHQPFARLPHSEASSAITCAPLATFTTKGAPTEVISEKTFQRTAQIAGQASLDGAIQQGCQGSQRNPYEEKACRGPAHSTVQAWWEQCQEWMLYYKCQSAPLVLDIKGFCMHSGARKRMLVLRLMYIWNIAQRGGKQERAFTSSSDDDSPDVRDPPEREDAEVDMTDI